MKHRLQSLAVIALLASSLGPIAIFGAVPAADAADPHHTVVSGDAMKWGPAPPSLPPGAQAAILLGSPAQEGPFVLRLKFPAGFIVPPHRHSKDELVTVISGRFAISSGEKLDQASFKPLPPGSFIHLPAGMPHYAMADGEVIVQINGMGPFDVQYIDPKDDPRLKKTQ
jgi:quercetin dioxygenase-like cupin family protein